MLRICRADIFRNDSYFATFRPGIAPPFHLTMPESPRSTGALPLQAGNPLNTNAQPRYGIALVSDALKE
jgi:hypothetical protein